MQDKNGNVEANGGEGRGQSLCSIHILFI